MDKIFSNINFLSKGVLRGSKGAWAHKLWVLKLIVPILIAVFLLIRIIEELAKIVFWFLDLLFDSINHITSKEHRKVYICTIIIALIVGMWLEHDYMWVKLITDFYYETRDIILEYWKLMQF